MAVAGPGDEVIVPRNAHKSLLAGLILGGALGNLSDRFFRGQHGAVVDYVDFHFFPSFNVADSCITVGCILLVLSILFDGRRT